MPNSLQLEPLTKMAMIKTDWFFYSNDEAVTGGTLSMDEVNPDERPNGLR